MIRYLFTGKYWTCYRMLKYNDRDRVGPTETVGCLAYSYN